jgi:nucleoporin SEH1
LKDHLDFVHDVAWAPNLGRDHELIVTSSRDQKIRFYKLTYKQNSWIIDLLSVHSDHQSEVQRIEWNTTGTLLISSGDDGNVRLWKSNFINQWTCISTFTLKHPSEEEKT